MPPPGELLHTTYDMWHSTGIDLAPYTRLYEVMRDRILGYDTPSDPAAGTFADGVANQAVVDAIRESSAAGLLDLGGHIGGLPPHPGSGRSSWSPWTPKFRGWTTGGDGRGTSNRGGARYR